MVDIQPRAVERAVGGFAAQQLDDAAYPALAGGVLALDDERTRAHAEQRAVATAVERQRGFIDLVVGGRGACRQEAGADPTHQVLAGHIVGANHDHAAAAPVANPVLRQRHSLGSAGAGGVDVRVGAARADVLGELAVSHRQDAEDEAAVKLVGMLLQLFLQLTDAAHNLAQRRRVGGVLTQLFERSDLLASVLPLVVAPELICHAVAAGEGAGKDDAGLVAQRFGEQPAVRQVSALARRAVGLHERNARLAQCIQPGGNRKLRGDVERLDQLLRDAVFLRQIKVAAAPGQLDHITRVFDYLEATAAVVALDQPRDAPARHLPAEALRDQVDELLAAQDAHGVVRIHHRLVGARQP